jgi:predicted DNA-binding protein
MVRKKGNRVHADLYLDPDKHEQLQRLSGLTRIPQAAYLREAVDDLLRKYAATLRKAAK